MVPTLAFAGAQEAIEASAAGRPRPPRRSALRIDDAHLSAGKGVIAAEARLKALMLRGLAGEAAGHAELLSELGGYLRAYFARRLGAGAADVEDLVQETLIAIHTKRDTYDPAQPFTPWAYAVARYKLIDHQRAVRRRPTTPIDSVEDLFAEQNPEEAAVRRDLDRLLSTLPDRQRRLMEGVKLQGLSMEEAAQGAGMTPVAVRVSIHRAFKTLMQRVRDEDR